MKRSELVVGQVVETEKVLVVGTVETKRVSAEPAREQPVVVLLWA